MSAFSHPISTGANIIVELWILKKEKHCPTWLILLLSKKYLFNKLILTLAQLLK